MENSPVTYNRISQDPTNFEMVFKRQLLLADDLRNGRVEYKTGNAESKALHGATRTLETDLSARMFEHRLDVHRGRQHALENRERSNDGQITDQRSQPQADDSSSKAADGQKKVK